MRVLERVRSQMIGSDNYGNHVDRGWVKEAEYFLNTEVPAAHRKNLKPIDIDILLDLELARTPDDFERENFKQRFARVTTGTQFEHFIKDELIALGWEVRHIGGSGDQGADLIASRNGVRVAIQCKLYSKPLNNESVQEVVAAKKFHETQAAVVVSNQPFNKSAQALAKANDVVHIGHDELQLFDDLFLVQVTREFKAPKAPMALTFVDQVQKVTSTSEFKRLLGGELIRRGWKVQDVENEDQGAELIAARGTYRIAIQCALYSKPLPILFVQQAAAARHHFGTDDAAVISNHPFDIAAEADAQDRSILHIEHTDIEGFDDLYKFWTTNLGRTA